MTSRRKASRRFSFPRFAVALVLVTSRTRAPPPAPVVTSPAPPTPTRRVVFLPVSPSISTMAAGRASLLLAPARLLDSTYCLLAPAPPLPHPTMTSLSALVLSARMAGPRSRRLPRARRPSGVLLLKSLTYGTITLASSETAATLPRGRQIRRSRVTSSLTTMMMATSTSPPFSNHCSRRGKFLRIVSFISFFHGISAAFEACFSPQFGCTIRCTVCLCCPCENTEGSWSS